MAESKVTRENFITIQGWMLSDLGLKGNDLVIYACIYGFSQVEGQTFEGSVQYLADWTNSTKRGVMKNLKSLTERGFLKKEELIVNGVKTCKYRAIKKFNNLEQSSLEYGTKFTGVVNKVHGGSEQSSLGGSEQSSPNNIDIDNIANNLKESKKESAKSSFNIIISNYSKGDEELTDLLGEWLKVRKAKRAAMTDRAIQMNIDKLDKLAAESKMSVPEYLKEVICRGWAAFYKITDYSKSGKPAAVTKSAAAYNSYSQRQHSQNDYDALERMLLNQQSPPDTAGNNPDIQARAEALQERLRG